MPLDATQAEATYNLAKTRLAAGLKAQGVDVESLPPGFFNALLAFFMSMLSGGCPPTPTPPAASVAAEQVKASAAANPGWVEFTLFRKARKAGMQYPMQCALAAIHVINGATVEELTAVAALDAEM